MNDQMKKNQCSSDSTILYIGLISQKNDAYKVGLRSCNGNTFHCCLNQHKAFANTVKSKNVVMDDVVMH